MYPLKYCCHGVTGVEFAVELGGKAVRCSARGKTTEPDAKSLDTHCS